VHEVESRTVRSSAVSSPGQRSELVLIVEDEDAVRELAAEFMKSAGYKVLTARDGHEAVGIAVSRNGGEPIRVLLTDIVMPNMRGPELAKCLKAQNPELKIIYMSGYLEFNKADGEFVEGGFFLQKPFSRDSLVSKVDDVLRQVRLQSSPAPITTKRRVVI
jgi:two-component system cell cycle sensor histidine kinase/response regulator CckA